MGDNFWISATELALVQEGKDEWVGEDWETQSGIQLLHTKYAYFVSKLPNQGKILSPFRALLMHDHWKILKQINPWMNENRSCKNAYCFLESLNVVEK